jgi:glutathione S-transferase
MSKPVVFGADYSVYVRIVRLALEQKGVGYDLVPVDVFAAGGLPEWYLEIHPFGRIPAFEHDGLKLYETSAVARYVDEAFDGPALQSSSARDRAVMNQVIGLLDAYAYRAMVWDVAVESLEMPTPDDALIAAGLRTANTVLKVLSQLKRPGPWFLGDRLTLADLHAGPIIGYFLKAPEGRALVSEHPVIADWWQRLSELPAYAATEPKS